MNIIAIAIYLDQCYRIYRSSNGKKKFISKWMANDHPCFLANDLLADDWEILLDGIIKEFSITYQES